VREVVGDSYFHTLMSSSGFNRTVEQIVGNLTKAEVLGCLPMGWIRATGGRTWASLKDAVVKLSDSMKTKVYEAACVKERLFKEKMVAGRKRKRMEYEWSSRTRVKRNDGEWNVVIIITRVE
jgi:hypothetical protein